MTVASHEDADAAHPEGVAYESSPLARGEYVTVLTHFYRGEMQRALTWRSRLDMTSNWAILATLGILTFSFNNPRYSQETLIAGMYANFVFLLIEARRFRFFDVWRARVRMIEENFVSPILRRDLLSPLDHWGESMAQDLLHPKFKITLRQALRARVLRNYGYVFGFLLVAWLGRNAAYTPAHGRGLDELFGIGEIPGWIPIVLVVLLYSILVLVVLFTPRSQPAELCYWPDPQHSGQDVPNLDV